MASDKAKYKELEKLVLELAPIWQERMGLSHFEIEQSFLDSFLGDDGEEDFKITACAETRWNYMQAKIKWYLPSAVRHSPERIEQTLVHELCHVLLNSEQTHVPSKGGDGVELATEMACRAIYNGWGTALS